VVFAVLALQGAFIEHRQKLSSIGVSSFEIRQLSDLKKPFDALILPGGESTTMRRLLDDLGLFKPIQALIQEGLPVLGTCAGMILLSQEIEQETYQHFATMPITVARNYFGRQLGSFVKNIRYQGHSLDMIFVRAPIVTKVSKDVKVLIEFDGLIAAVRYKNQIALAFHPELGKSTYFHRQLVSLVEQRSN
jgi:pyridoxal 5'-phosphate synthase pdxT subunit